MTCDTFVSALDQFLAGDVDASDTTLVRHADGCAACARRLAQAIKMRDAASIEPTGSQITRARKRLREAFAAAGRPPIRFGRLKTPIGTVYVGLSDRGVCNVTFDAGSEEEYRSRLAARAPEVWEDAGALEPALHQMDDYFSGKRRSFSLPIDLRSVSPFTMRVLEAACDIPFGRLVSYGELASRLGDVRASRAVGGALGRNPVPIIVPCHRVVAQGGRIGGYTGGLDTKRVLLKLEGTLPNVR